MSSFKKRMSASNIKWIITFVLIAILSASIIFAFVKIDKNEKTKTLGTNSFTYAIGLLDAKGEYEQGTSSIYLKDYHSVDGLKCEIAKDSTIVYMIYFYDSEMDFLFKTDALETNFESSDISEGVEYFRIVITPTNDAEVSFFEINDYAGQLTVSVNK